MSAEKLLEMLDKATAEDVADLDEQIGEAEKRLDAMRSLRRMMSLRVEGKPERKPRQKTSAATSPASSAGETGNITDERRNRVAKYLLKSGSAKASTLAEFVGASQGFHWVLKNPWFVVKGDYVQLTQEGKDAAAKL